MNTQKDTSSDEIEKLYLEFLEYLDTKPGNDIPGILIDIESKIKALLEGRKYLSQKYGENRDSVERKIMHKITGDSVNIGNLLETLAKKVQEILKKSPEDIDREMGIFVKELVGIILPPGEGNIREGSGKLEVREEKELSESRYGKILEILRENEIYADDIIVYKGQLRTNQMRQTSYRVIQIPRLSKTIFVCDEYGEASFVVDSLVYPEVFLEHTKSDIREKLSATRIIHSLAWETRMIEAIFGNSEERKVRSASEKNQTQKIDVRKMEEMREEILKQFPTPEHLMSLNKKGKGELKIHGKGLVKIARIFGVAGDPVGYSRDMALFGQKIYGEGHSILECELWTPAKWKEEIMRLFPTVDDWIDLNQRQRLELKIYGRGCIAIATIFGVSGNPIYNSGDIALLGQKIYGEGHSILECELYTPAKWKEEILRQFPTVDDWISLNHKQKVKLKIHGKGLIKIARIFGVAGDPVGYSRDMGLLGQKIYGPNPVFDIYLEEDITIGWTREKWKEEILKKYTIPEDWMSLKYEKKCELKIQGKGLRAISTIFGVSLDPIGVSRDMALLGEEIYGASSVFDRYIQNKE